MPALVFVLLFLALAAVLLAGWAALPFLLVLIVAVFGLWIAVRSGRGKTPTPR